MQAETYRLDYNCRCLRVQQRQESVGDISKLAGDTDGTDATALLKGAILVRLALIEPWNVHTNV